MKKPSVAIIILNWNGKDDTKLCLDSLSKSEYKDFEVVLVDNGSKDGSQEELGKFIKELSYNTEFVKKLENLGFTGGNIEGLKHCEGKYVVLLNNDIVADPKWLGYLVESAKKDKKVGVVGGRAYMWNEDNPPFDKKNDYYSFQVLDPYLGYIHAIQGEEKSTFADSISGCAVLIKREVIEKVGFLDPTFFCYYEETDLFARIIRAGYKVYYDSRAQVWHAVAKTSGYWSYFYLYQMARNRAIFGIRNFDKQYYQYFKKDLLKKGIRSFFSYYYHLPREKNENAKIDRKSRKNAFVWICLHWFALQKERRKIVAKGSYNDGLLWDKDESVSVIIPSYNYGKYIGKTVESVLNQTVKPLEIIVVDDESTDNSVEVIKRYPVKLIQQKNISVGSPVDAKNNGFKASKGRFILFLDADDILRKDAIEKYLKAYREDKTVGFVYSDAEYFGAEKGVISGKDFSPTMLRDGNYIHNSSLMKREVFEAVGGYHSGLDVGYEDWDLYISIIEQGYKGKYVPEPLLDYRRHKGENSRNVIEQGAALEIHYHVFERHKQMFPLWYRIYKKTYYKLYYGAIDEKTGLAIKYGRFRRYNLLIRLVFFMFRLMSKFFTLVKLILKGDIKVVFKKVKGELHFWKALAQRANQKKD